MATARAKYVKRKGLRRTEKLLSHNRYLSAAGSTFGLLSNLFMRLPGSKWLLEKTTGLDRRRSMPSFARGSFLKTGRRYLNKCRSLGKPIDKVAYFVDTYANYNDHELGFAVLDVLRHNNIEVILPSQRPSPLPAIVYGDIVTAKRDLSFSVKHLAEAVRNGYQVVCSEPSAALCLKEELRHLVESEDARIVSENTHELMNYLLGLYRKQILKAPEKDVMQEYLYHLPCHLCAVGEDIATIELLQKHFGIKVHDLKAGCCGLAGTFGMQKKNYDLSIKISNNLKEALKIHPRGIVLTECAACKMQIEHISNCEVRHPIKVIAECYRGSL
jgi:Fe-S oxidoreductase